MTYATITFLECLLHCSRTSIWLCFLPSFLTDCRWFPGKAHQLQYASKVSNVMATHIFYEKLLYKKPVLNFLTNYNINTRGYFSLITEKKWKIQETFSNEAQPEFLIKIVILVMTNIKDGIFWYFHPLFRKKLPKVLEKVSAIWGDQCSAKFYMLVMEGNNKLV